MSQTFVQKHNYDERGTFKIYRSFGFGHVNFERESYGHDTLAAASPVRHYRGRQKVLIPECDPTGSRVMVNRSSSVPVRSYSGIDTFLSAMTAMRRRCSS